MSSIRLATASNVRALKDLSAALSQNGSKWTEFIDLETLEDEIGRFRVWSGNLGALQKGHSSLDYRLRDSPLLSSNALKFLTELQENLQEAHAVVSGARLPYEQQQISESVDEDEDDDFFEKDDGDDDNDSTSSRSELNMRFAEIVDIIDNLYKLSVRIRTPTLRSRSLKAAAYKPKDPESGVDLMAIYAAFDLRHTKELVSQLRVPHVEEGQSNENDYLVARLSAAITSRRRHFMYWKRHRNKLGLSTVSEEQAQPMQVTLHQTEDLQRSDTHETQQAEAPALHLSAPEAPSHRTGKTLLSGTEATQHHQSLDDMIDTKSVTSYAVTVRDIHGKGVNLPPPPRTADGERDFECPFCYIICPARYGRGRAWRTHILQDLQPYVCTYADCDSSEQLFRSRREWAEHEASHRKVWRCPEHPTAIYNNHLGLEDHLRREHMDSIPENQLKTIVKVGETTTIDSRPKCPICFASTGTEGLDDFHNHIANHLERISTFALPNGTENDSEGASSAASRGRSDSGSSQDMDSLSLPSDTSDGPTGAGRLNIESTSPDVEGAGITLEEHQLAQPADRMPLSLESLKSLPDASKNRLESLLLGHEEAENAVDIQNKPGAERSVSPEGSDSHIPYLPATEEPIIGISDIPTLRQLYRTRRLLQRDQSYAPNDYYNQTISLCQYDITKLRVDAIINGGNKNMKTRGGNTLNAVIHRAAGAAFTRKAKTKKFIVNNEAILMDGYDLPSKHVIHVLRPGYTKVHKGMEQFKQLTDCYRSALQEAASNNFKTVAFPCLGTGHGGFPAGVAARIVLQEIREYLDAHPEYVFERIIFSVNNVDDEEVYMNFLPVFFPPTHGDLDEARNAGWSVDRNALATQVTDTLDQVETMHAELSYRLSTTVPDYPPTIHSSLKAIESGLTSVRRSLIWSAKIEGSFQDLRLLCTVLRALCGNVRELIELVKDISNVADRTDQSIWDDYMDDMKNRYGTDLDQFLQSCQMFLEHLKGTSTRDGSEVERIATIRQKLEVYKLKDRTRGGPGLQDRLNALDETLYLREFQREAVAETTPTRKVVRVQDIRSLAQLYRLGELEERTTLAHPSAMSNHIICFVREDITKLKVDIMVNSTNRTFEGMGTLDRTVKAKGGPELNAKLDSFGACRVGDVKLTSGYALPAKHVLHVIPPGSFGKTSKGVLRKIYREVLHQAVALRATSIAIPCVGTGSLGYPRRDSAALAIEEVKRFLESADPSSLLEKIIFVVYASNDEYVYKSLLPVYFPPIDLNANRSLPPTQPQRGETATTESKASESSRRSLFGSLNEAFRSVQFSSSKRKPTELRPRPINADEEHVLLEFELHAQECEVCKDPKRLYIEGRDLCEPGYAYAQMVLWNMEMRSDVVYTRPDRDGQMVELEIAKDMFSTVLALLSTVQRSYREGDQSRPFVSKTRKYEEIIRDQALGPSTLPGVTIDSAKVEVPVEGEPKKARAHVHTWSALPGEWVPLSPNECHIRVYVGKVDIHAEEVKNTRSTPLLSLKLDHLSTCERRKTTPEVILGGGTTSDSTNFISLFKCRSDSECTSLLRTLRRAIESNQGKDDTKVTPDPESGDEENLISFRKASVAEDTYPAWNKRLQDIRNELASVEKDNGGLSDLQLKMQKLSTATSSMQSASPGKQAAVSDLYDTSRSPLGTRVMLCLMADLKSRPGSYIGLGTNSIVSAVRATPEEVATALEELVAEGQIHNTIDENTWVVSHPPTELPTIFKDEPIYTSPTPQVRDATTFADTPPSPTAPFVRSSSSDMPIVITYSSPYDLGPVNMDDRSEPSSASARWTRINKRLVDSQVLVEADEEFDDTGDSYVVHRVLRREDVRRWADLSREIRERRHERSGKGGKSEKDQAQQNLDRVLAGDMKETDLRRFADTDDERFL